MYCTEMSKIKCSSWNVMKKFNINGYCGDMKEILNEVMSDLEFLVSCVVMSESNLPIKKQVNELRQISNSFSSTDQNSMKCINANTIRNELYQTKTELEKIKSEKSENSCRALIDDTKSEELNEMNKKLSKSNARIKELEQDFQNMAKIKEELEKKLKESKKCDMEKEKNYCDDENKIEAELSEEIIRLKTRIGELDLKIKKNEFFDTSDYKRELDNHIKQIRKLTQENEEKSKEIEQLKDLEKKYHKDKEEYEKNVEMSKTNNYRVNRENAQLKSQLQKLNENGYEKLIEVLTNERDKLNNELNAKDEKIKELEQKLNKETSYCKFKSYNFRKREN